MGIGRKFHEETKYYPEKIPAGFYSHDKTPKPYKTYPGSKRLKLLDPETSGGMPLWDVLNIRRSERSYGSGPISAEELSQLLWAAQGITEKFGGYLLRTAPSAGALYPIETYISVREVTDIPQAIYHLDVREWEIEEVKAGDFSGELSASALGQKMVGRAGVVFIWTAIFLRSSIKYKERGYRYVFLDCGHIAQNILLAVTALGLGACPIGALYDEEVNDIIGIDGTEESILYMASVGRAQ